MAKSVKSNAKAKPDPFAGVDVKGAAKGRSALKVAPGGEAGYTAADIEVLEGLEPVRRRPGMYIGGTDEKALHHLFAEVIDNSMDEALAGHATFIEVELDAEGFLTLTGREKELIIRGGAKISPVEIDACLMQRADVIEAATVGVPDNIYGEEVVSYVVVRAGADAGEILRYCAAVLGAFKTPKEIVLSASLPKNPNGKLDRRALAERWQERSSG